jgi:acyl-CoA thioester hydrolase
MNVMWYAGKFDEASWQLLSRLGLTRVCLQREGAGMAAVEQLIEYRRELRAGDVVTIRSSILETMDKAIRMRHEMTNDETGDIAAITEIVGVHMDARTRKARSLPSDVRATDSSMPEIYERRQKLWAEVSIGIEGGFDLVEFS